VEAVVPGQPDRLRFTLAEHGIERHDGIQIDVPERERPFGFSAEDLWLQGRPVFEAPRGATVEVALPESHPRLPEGAVVYCSSSQAVKRTYRWSRPRPGQHRVRRPIAVRVEFTSEALHARLQAGDLVSDTAWIVDEPLGEARTPESVPSAVERAFSKLGDTEFSLASVEVVNPQGLFAPASALNDLRRRAVEELAERLAVARTSRLAQLNPRVCFPATETAETWSVLTDQPELLGALRGEDWDEIVLDISRASWGDIETAVSEVPKDRLRLALPAICRGEEESELLRRIALLREQGYGKWQIANLSGLDYLGSLEDLDVLADWPLYVLNTPAMNLLDSVGLRGWTLSPEDGKRNLVELLQAAGTRSTLVVYQDTPLAVSATCLFASAQGFCPGLDHCEANQQSWTTRTGDRLLAVNDHCRSVVLNDQPFCLSGRLAGLRDAGAKRFRVDLVWRGYTPEDARQVWRSVRADQRIPRTHTGNLDRELDHA
jgi:hypothetical protein